jgi:hypothetical protein
MGGKMAAKKKAAKKEETPLTTAINVTITLDEFGGIVSVSKLEDGQHKAEKVERNDAGYPDGKDNGRWDIDEDWHIALVQDIA